MYDRTTGARGRNGMLLLAVIFIGYFVFGVSENMKGPALPRMQDDFGLSEWQLGLLLAINSIGFLIACSFAERLIRVIGSRATLAATFAAMTLSGVFIGIAPNYPLFTAAFFLLYLGNGLLEIGLAVVCARLFTKNTGFMMNLSHFFYGLSSTVSPIGAAAVMGWTFGGGEELGWRGMYIVLLLVCAVPLLPALLARFPEMDNDEESDEAPVTWRSFLRDKVAWCVVVLLALGVTAELGAGGWMVNYLEKVHGFSPVRASGMMSLFFLCFMIARLAFGALTDRIGFVRSIILFAGACGLLSCVGVLIGEHGAVLLALAGAGIGPVYPTVMAFLARRYTRGTSAAITFTVTAIGILGVAGNFIIGGVTDAFGYEAGYLVIGGCALACAAAGAVLYSWLRKEGRLI